MLRIHGSHNIMQTLLLCRKILPRFNCNLIKNISLVHTNLISCFTDFWTQKIGTRERFENF